jgi:hypothetical protein
LLALRFERSPSPITIFLSNQLLVDIIYFCYTFSVTRKHPMSPAAPHNTTQIFVASALKSPTHDALSPFPANR